MYYSIHRVNAMTTSKVNEEIKTGAKVITISILFYGVS